MWEGERRSGRCERRALQRIDCGIQRQMACPVNLTGKHKPSKLKKILWKKIAIDAQILFMEVELELAVLGYQT